MRLGFILALCLSVMGTLSSASAQQASRLYSDISAQELVDLFSSAGIAAQIDPNQGEGRFIRAQYNGLNFSVLLRVCTQGISPRCRGAWFGIGLPPHPRATVQTINNFNMNFPAFKSFVAGDNSVALVDYLIMDEGVTPANILANTFVYLLGRDALVRFVTEQGTEEGETEEDIATAATSAATETITQAWSGTVVKDDAIAKMPGLKDHLATMEPKQIEDFASMIQTSQEMKEMKTDK